MHSQIFIAKLLLEFLGPSSHEFWHVMTALHVSRHVIDIRENKDLLVAQVDNSEKTTKEGR